MKPGLNRRTQRNRKKNLIPLSKLRAAEVVRTVVDHPRRLDELVNLLQDKDRAIRGRAAATLARLSESHPGRLIRHLESLREALGDDAAFVRWHVVYVIGQVIACCPLRASFVLSDVSARMTDEDRLVRRFACRALEHVARLKPQLIDALYSANREAMPTEVARILRGADPGEL